MNIEWALFIYLLVVIIIFVIARRMRIRIFSSLSLALLLAWIALQLIYPINRVITEYVPLTWKTLYTIIFLITPLVIFVYVLLNALTDRYPAKAVTVIAAA